MGVAQLPRLEKGTPLGVGLDCPYSPTHFLDDTEFMPISSIWMDLKEAVVVLAETTWRGGGKALCENIISMYSRNSCAH